MKKQLFYFLILFLIVFAGFNSCTIKKRLYEPGYHVAWNKTKKEHKPNDRIETIESDNIIVVKEIVSNNQENNIIESNLSETSQEIEPLYAPSSENLNSIEINSTSQRNPISFNTKKVPSEVHKSLIKERTKESSDRKEPDKKVHWAAIIGFVLSIVSPFTYYIIGLGALIICIASIVFSGISLNAKFKNPDKYKSNGLAIAGIIIGIIHFLSISLFFLLIFLILFG